MIKIVSSITHNLIKMLINKYLCKLLSIVLATTLFTFVSSIGWSGYVFADEFGCYDKICTPPQSNALKNSPVCEKGKDYRITSYIEGESDVIVLSIHGGLIEAYTSEISRDIARRNGWKRYDFFGEIKNPKCAVLADLNSNNLHYDVLHITSTGFDEPKAVELVMSHKNAISIHGYERKEKPGLQTICVGGANKDKIQIFIESVNKKSDKLKGLFDYSLNLVDVPTAVKPGNSTENNSICLVNDNKKPDPLTGSNPKNIVNRNNKNGLQLELNKRIRADLAKGIDDRNDNSPDENQLLRNIIYDAIEEAMRD